MPCYDFSLGNPHIQKYHPYINYNYRVFFDSSSWKKKNKWTSSHPKKDDALHHRIAMTPRWWCFFVLQKKSRACADEVVPIHIHKDVFFGLGNSPKKRGLGNVDQ